MNAILTALRQLGLDTLISREPSRQRNLVLTMIAQRIITPRSKLGTTREWDKTILAQELNIDTTKEDADSLYAAMDWLLQRQHFIEQKLARRHLSEQSIILYDISSSYVEGDHCPLAKFGHNRDGKEGKKIIVYGLLTDSRGCPVSILVYSGNIKSIQEESEVDGFYVIRTNIPSEEREASDIVRDYKCLADVEKSFRTIKTTLLHVRPIHHRLEKRVRAHFFICMLSYLRALSSPASVGAVSF